MPSLFINPCYYTKALCRITCYKSDLSLAGVDFLSNRDFEINFSNSVKSQNISVSIIQDDISELDETFTLSLESVSLFDTYQRVTVNLTEGDRDRLLFTIRETTVTIQDDDGKYNLCMYRKSQRITFLAVTIFVLFLVTVHII